MELVCEVVDGGFGFLAVLVVVGVSIYLFSCSCCLFSRFLQFFNKVDGMIPAFSRN